MATENSPPQIRIILTVAFSSVVILAALNSVFRSYFLMMTEEVEHDHLSKPTELLTLREGEQKNLTSSPIPITEAMHELATRGRTNYAAFMSQADITPQQSTDTGPIVGWVRNPNTAALDAINAAADAADGGTAAVEAAGDGGAMAASAASDGGVLMAPHASDAGATPLSATPGPHAPATKDAGAHSK